MREFRIDDINKTVVFKFDYDPEIVSEIKRCDYNARWNPELKEWIVPVNQWSKIRILALITKFFFHREGEKEIKNIDFSYIYSKIDTTRLEEICKEKDFAYTPRQYQLVALGYSIMKKSLINGDDVGLGKTYESILYAEISNSFPCLVIEPSSIKYNWKEKWEEITKGRRSISVIDSDKEGDWTADVVIINYDIIGKKQGKGATVKYPELLDIPWKMAICDEAHFLKEKKSQRSRAASKILKKIDRVQLLTGTAIMNKPIEIWNLLVLIGKEKMIADNWMQFVQKYCGGYKGKFGWVTDGATNILELNKKLRETCYIRREKSEVMSELAPVSKQIIEAPISNQKEYEKATKDLIEYIREKKGDESAEKAMEAQHLVMISVLRKLAIEGKLKYIEQYLKDWQTGEKGKLVVFGIHKEGLEYLSKKFKCPLIAGGVAAVKKQKIVNDWQKSDDIFLFANIASGGTGVDGLQNVCSNALILELPWKPAELDQTIGRIHRSGQTLPVMITFILNRNTIDEQMWDMLSEKEIVTAAINKGVDIRKDQSGLKHVLRKIVENFSSK